MKSFVDTSRGREFITHGINNNFDDQPVNYNDVLGIMIDIRPTTGMILTFFRSTAGMIVMFSTFATILIGLYISFLLSNDIRSVGK